MFIAIVPAYNEEKRIGSVVRDLFDHVDEVVVVDDASKDGTAVLAKEAGATVIRHKINRGQGAALETGHAYARTKHAEYVLHFDGDGQLDVQDIPFALSTIRTAQADMLLGSRFLDARTEMPATKRYIIHPLGRFINRFFWNVRMSDAHNGFRILHRNALHTIRVEQDRMAHATEIPAQAVARGLEVIEHPVKITYHEYGQGMRGGIAVIKDLFIGIFIK